MLSIVSPTRLLTTPRLVSQGNLSDPEAKFQEEDSNIDPFRPPLTEGRHATTDGTLVLYGPLAVPAWLLTGSDDVRR